jgi:hypothetical protein
VAADVSGYNIANTRLTVFRGTSDDGFGDDQHRLDPDAAVAKDVPATITGAKKTVLVAQDSWDTTAQFPRNTEPLIVRVSAAANRKVPGGIQTGDLLKDQRRDRLFAVKTVTEPYAVGRSSPDLVFEIDRLT